MFKSYVENADECVELKEFVLEQIVEPNVSILSFVHTDLNSIRGYFKELLNNVLFFFTN